MNEFKRTAQGVCNRLKKAVDGAEFYNRLKQQEAAKAASKPAKKRENPLKSLMRIFNRGK